MKRPEKIIIKGYSGFCISEEAYEDQLIITPESVEYELKTQEESWLEPKSWKYTSKSKAFSVLYQGLASAAASIVESEFCVDVLDAPQVEMKLHFSDSSTLSKNIAEYIPGMETLVMLIGYLVPSVEEMPKSAAVLKENCEWKLADRPEE